MGDFVAALGLVLVIEGVLYALAPGGAKRLAATALSLSDAQLRRGGLIAAFAGLGLVWLVRAGG